jgi:hypothetical protein
MELVKPHSYYNICKFGPLLARGPNYKVTEESYGHKFGVNTIGVALLVGKGSLPMDADAQNLCKIRAPQAKFFRENLTSPFKVAYFFLLTKNTFF